MAPMEKFQSQRIHHILVSLVRSMMVVCGDLYGRSRFRRARPMWRRFFSLLVTFSVSIFGDEAEWHIELAIVE